MRYEEIYKKINYTKIYLLSNILGSKQICFKKPQNSLIALSNSLCSTPTPCKLRGVCFKQSLRGVTRAFYKVKNRGQVFKTMGNTKTLLYRTLRAILDSAKSSVRS